MAGGENVGDGGNLSESPEGKRVGIPEGVGTLEDPFGFVDSLWKINGGEMPLSSTVEPLILPIVLEDDRALVLETSVSVLNSSRRGSRVQHILRYGKDLKQFVQINRQTLELDPEEPVGEGSRRVGRNSVHDSCVMTPRHYVQGDLAEAAQVIAKELNVPLEFIEPEEEPAE